MRNLKKKLSVLLVAAIVILLAAPVSSAFAYTGGFLNGVTMTKGHFEQNNSGGTTTTVTDGDSSTYISLEKWGGVGDTSLDLVWYEFSQVKAINAIRINAEVANGYFTFFNASGTAISSVSFTNKNDQYIYFNKVENVKKVAIINGVSGTTHTNKIFEADVFFVPSPAPNDLTATAIKEDQSINLNWSIVNGVKSYNVKRSVTEGGPYESLGSVSGNSYEDKNVEFGITYYYIITAVNDAGESGNSNEAFATLRDAGRALLTITMITGMEKEYDLTFDEVNNFISWYENKQAGTGTASYMIDKHNNNKGPFKSRKDYVIFDKILIFEVSEYELTEDN